MREILTSMSVLSLKREISKTNIKGYSKMKKAEVINLMMKPEHRLRFSHLAKKGVKKERLPVFKEITEKKPPRKKLKKKLKIVDEEKPAEKKPTVKKAKPTVKKPVEKKPTAPKAKPTVKKAKPTVKKPAEKKPTDSFADAQFIKSKPKAKPTVKKPAEKKPTSKAKLLEVKKPPKRREDLQFSKAQIQAVADKLKTPTYKVVGEQALALEDIQRRARMRQDNNVDKVIIEKLIKKYGGTIEIEPPRNLYEPPSYLSTALANIVMGPMYQSPPEWNPPEGLDLKKEAIKYVGKVGDKISLNLGINRPASSYSRKPNYIKNDYTVQKIGRAKITFRRVQEGVHSKNFDIRQQVKNPKETSLSERKFEDRTGGYKTVSRTFEQVVFMSMEDTVRTLEQRNTEHEDFPPILGQQRHR